MKSLFFVLLAIASFSADSFGQTVINSVPYTISAPGTYVLGANLIYSSATGQAIRIVSSNVTLDLGGHYLYNPGVPGSNIGVYVQNAGNVNIQNGIVAGFFYGVYLSDAGGATLNSGNIVQNLKLTINQYGIVLAGTQGSSATNNQITGPTGNGAIGILVGVGSGNVVSGNIISAYNGGIESGGNNYLFENTVSNCGTALFMQPGDKYRSNTTFNCSTPFNGGIALTSDNN
jgi:hypothetical protein